MRIGLLPVLLLVLLLLAGCTAVDPGGGPGQGPDGGAGGGEGGEGNRSRFDDPCRSAGDCLTVLSSSSYINHCCRQAVAEVRNDHDAPVTFSILFEVEPEVADGRRHFEASTQFSGILHPGERAPVRAQLPQDQQDADFTFTPTAADLVEPGTTDPGLAMEVLDSSLQVDGDLVRVNGTVANQGDHPVRTHLVLSLYDAQANLVGLARINGRVGGEPSDEEVDRFHTLLHPGQRATFEVETQRFGREVATHAVAPEAEVAQHLAVPVDPEAKRAEASEAGHPFASGDADRDGPGLTAELGPLQRDGDDTFVVLTARNALEHGLVVTDAAVTFHTDAGTVFGSLHTTFAAEERIAPGGTWTKRYTFDDPGARIAEAGPFYVVARTASGG